MYAFAGNPAATAYLAFEQTSSERHNYVAGQVYGIAGGSEEHDLITGNFYEDVELTENQDRRQP